MSETESEKKKELTPAATPSSVGIMKDRSVAACLSGAFELYCSNFATIFRHSWLPSLVLSVLSATGTLLVDNQLPIAVAATLAVCSLLGVIFVGAWYDASYVILFNGMERRETIKRALCARLVSVAYAFAAFAIGAIAAAAVYFIAIGKGSQKAAVSFATTAMAPTIALVIIVAVCAAVPLVYSITSYLVNPATTLRAMLTSLYKRGWRNWGYLFGVTALTVLVLAVVVAVLAAPSLVLSAALGINHAGMALGDPDALPSYFMPLFCATSVVVRFVFCYAAIWGFLTALHAYGAIECRTEERAKRKAVNN